MLEIASTWLLVILSGTVLMAAMIMLLITFLLCSAKTLKADDAHDHRIVGLKKLRINMLKVFLLNTSLLLLAEGIIKLFG
ncbi:MAG TPA: hypothetical protein PL066_00510 [bacterium]|nr:hypothetical protein [bacterium]